MLTSTTTFGAYRSEIAALGACNDALLWLDVVQPPTFEQLVQALDGQKPSWAIWLLIYADVDTRMRLRLLELVPRPTTAARMVERAPHRFSQSERNVLASRFPGHRIGG